MGDSGSLTLGFFLAFLFVKAIAVNPEYYANVSKTRTDSIQSAHHTYF